jgi:NitT/TauT family transport system ATP-binding protein
MGGSPEPTVTHTSNGAAPIPAPPGAGAAAVDMGETVSPIPPSRPIIEIDRLDVVFQAPGGAHHLAVQDASLRVDAGSFVCLVGPSGCGKSTLLNAIAGRIKPSRGSVLYDGAPVSGLNRRTGYITQEDNLLPWRTVARNVGIALELRGTPKAERTERIDAILEKVGLTGFANHYPSQLSGGMRKRAALARTLVYEPETLLMDEPFGAVDAQLRATLQQELLRIWSRQDTRTTVVFVTHDLEEALLLADAIYVFATNPGRVIHREDIGWPRPRDLVDLRTEPAFGEKWHQLWELLRRGSDDGGSR